MKKDAESHEAEDKKKKERVELKNQAESVVFSTEKLIKESGDKIKAEDKKELENKIAELKKVQQSDDIEELKKKMEAVNEVAQKIGASMYQNAEKKDQKQEKTEEKKKEDKDEVVEGEVEDDKENKDK
jgi:molecular chaperone DnaK